MRTIKKSRQSVTQATEALLARKGLRNIKSCLAKEIFKDELIQIYKKQTDYRNELKADSKALTERLVNELRHGDFNENIAQLLFKLNNMLYHTKGKKVYGYLSPEIKAVVNLIVDELEKDECIKALYALWYEQKDKITSTYTNEKLKRIPLSQNKEFKSVRNMVIREALDLDDMIAIFDDDATDEPILLSIDETEPEPDDEEIDDELYMLTSSEKYWRAKRLLDKKSEQFDFGKGFVLLKESAEEGNPYAQYRLGKMMIKGNMCDKDIRSGIYWLEQSVKQGNQWAEYYLSKQYLGNSDTSRNFKRAIFLLSESAEQGNEYATVILQNRKNYLKYSMAMSTMRLFGYMGNLFSRKFNTDKSKTGFRIDSKQYAQIQEKKLAQALK